MYSKRQWRDIFEGNITKFFFIGKDIFYKCQISIFIFLNWTNQRFDVVWFWISLYMNTRFCNFINCLCLVIFHHDQFISQWHHHNISCFLLFSFFLAFKIFIYPRSSCHRQAFTHSVRLFVFTCVTLSFFFHYSNYTKKRDSYMFLPPIFFLYPPPPFL